MSILRSVLNTVFLALWTAFMVTVAVVLSAVRGDFGVFRRMQRQWANGLVRFWGVHLGVFGAEHMDTAASYVVVSNHLSWADIVVLFIALPTTPGFLAKRELLRVPFLAAALRSGGHVIIDRGRRASAVQALHRAAEEIRGGKTVLVFPEGTRGDSDTIGEFKKGGFHLARDAKVPILPVGVRGSRAVFPRDGLLIHPGRVEVHIGAPVPADEVERTPVDQLVARVRSDVMALSAMPARESVQGEPRPA
jgi:1-acyl-sn-glycerol-3-phosphate acyltransferase